MKPRSRFYVVSLVAMAGAMLAGCGGKSQWEITVENKGTSPCSVYVTMDYAGGGAQGNDEVSVKDMAAGEKLTSIVGERARTIRSVKVVRGEAEQELKPNVELAPGRRYQIVVTADGKIDASLADGN